MHVDVANAATQSQCPAWRSYRSRTNEPVIFSAVWFPADGGFVESDLRL